MNTQNIRTIVENANNITDFQRKVYLALLDVPCGKTISYKELGERIGCPNPRAIGQALKRNPFSPFVPCHRVISSNGNIGGFFGKTDVKAKAKKLELLQKEGVILK